MSTDDFNIQLNKYENSLSKLSAWNNAWSSITNFQQGNPGEAFRSLSLFISDSFGFLFDAWKKEEDKVLRQRSGQVGKFGTLIHNTYQLSKRLSINLDKWFTYTKKDYKPVFEQNKDEIYRNNKVPKSLVNAIISDTTALVANLMSITLSMEEFLVVS